MHDEDLPRPKQALLVPAVLEPLGVGELVAYVAALRTEIGRAEAEIARKKGVRGAADAVFGRPLR